MAELADGYRWLYRGKFTEAFNHAGRNLKQNYYWPSAHFLMGKSCSLIENCPREMALFHLKESVEMNPKPETMIEPYLSLKQQEEVYKLWLAVASQASFEGTDEYYLTILKVLKLHQLTLLNEETTPNFLPSNSDLLQLIYASWIPSSLNTVHQSNVVWKQYKQKMEQLLYGHDKFHSDHEFNNEFNITKMRPGSIDLEDPLVAAAYSLQFFHAYIHPSHTKEALSLFAKAIEIGVDTKHFQHYHPRASKKKRKKKKSVCIVSSYLHGGHQLVRIFDEVIRRLPDEGWKVAVAHISKNPMGWRMMNQGTLALFDQSNKQFLVDERVDIIPLPRFGQPCPVKLAHKQPQAQTQSSQLDSSVKGFMQRATLAITSQDFNIVLFTELGMDYYTYLLAHNRLAIDSQLSAWGHPVTSGLTLLDGWVMHDAALSYNCFPDQLANLDDEVDVDGLTESQRRCLSQSRVEMQSHYTEKLVYLSGFADREYRISHRHINNFIQNEEVSAITGRPILSKYEIWKKLGFYDQDHEDEFKVIALMQASHKVHPDFDVIISEITNNPRYNVRLVVLDAALAGSEASQSKDGKKKKRKISDFNAMKRKGVGMEEKDEEEIDDRENLQKRFERLNVKNAVYVDFLPHEELLAIFRYAHLSLDSFYFGGDGTSREAFEMHCPVVTMPHYASLGSKWTASLYHLMKMHPIKLTYQTTSTSTGDNQITELEAKIDLRDMVNGEDTAHSGGYKALAPIASNQYEYLQLVFLLLENDEYYQLLKNHIFKRVDMIYERKDAVKSWSQLLTNQLPSSQDKATIPPSPIKSEDSVSKSLSEDIFTSYSEDSVNRLQPLKPTASSEIMNDVDHYSNMKQYTIPMSLFILIATLYFLYGKSRTSSNSKTPNKSNEVKSKKSKRTK